MASRFRLAMAQAAPTVGALEANARKVMRLFQKARQQESDFVAFPEMFLAGYPPQDLVLKRVFVQDCINWIDVIARNCADGPALGIGTPYIEDGKVFNAYFVISRGKVVARKLKHHLPNTDVFDEARLFSRGPIGGPCKVGPVRIGIPICEDAWFEDICETLSESGAEILIVPNGSPYHRNKLERRHVHMVSRVVETGLPLAYLNMVGGQDDQYFDGGSFVLNPHGELAAQFPLFEESLFVVDFEHRDDGWTAARHELATIPGEWEQDYQVMVHALRDYLSKSGFSRALLGLSGGVDSALVATIAADAVGPENVRCVLLPSEYTSKESRQDAEAVARNLGCRIDEIEIFESVTSVMRALRPLFDQLKPDVTEENIQSRMRSVLLMAISNKFGELLLTTGNKSEAAVGYATIYGDMAGGYNPIKDLYKTRVFESCRWRNANHRDWMLGPKGGVIPKRVIEKPPSAELRENQRDSDSLPPYEVLDRILEMLIDRDKAVEDVVAAGFDQATVKRVEQLIYGAEYKRFQSAPGTRLTGRALWLDRRYPIVNHWRDLG